MGFFSQWRRRRSPLPSLSTSRGVPAGSTREHDVPTAALESETAGAESEVAPAVEKNLVTPVTRARIITSLRRSNYRYLIDENGDACGLWAYRFFSFYLVRGQVLQVRGRWSRQASIDHLSEILAFSDRWNRERSAPKVYVRVHDDGRVHVLTEVSVPVVAGLSDDQMDHYLAIGLASGGLVFDELDQLYPDPVLATGGDE